MILSLQGFSCTLHRDDVVAKEINRGALLVAYDGDKSCMLDRFDCRGYMQDLRNYESHFEDVVLSHDEWEIEQSCDYERYYDIYHNNDSKDKKNDLKLEDAASSNICQPKFTAVGYEYSNNTLEEKNEKVIEKNDNADLNDPTNDAEYICPSSLILPSGMTLPDTEREAAIIEQTARFVAEKGTPFEILIKTKQANNSRFSFLNYDHKLYPFYRHITQLIKSAQYIPAKRHSSHLIQTIDEVSEKPVLQSDVSALKVDISNTPYGKLIERFKQSQEKKKESKIKQVLQDVLQPCDNGEKSLTQKEPSPEPKEVVETRQRMYQELYHQYFPFYFQHCKDMYGHLKPHDVLTEMARDYAASSAAAWIQSNMSETAMINQKQDEDDRIMKKMAEYVAKNGEELEQIMFERNKERFDFLLLDNVNNNKYKKFLKEELLKLRPQMETSFEPPQQSIDCIIDSYGLHSPPHSMNNGPISFKMTSNKLKSTPAVAINSVQSDDFEDDFDFTDRLISKSSNASKTKPSRLSRFSPANPKNIEIIAAAFNCDIQTHRKRKAEEFLASLSQGEKVQKL